MAGTFIKINIIRLMETSLRPLNQCRYYARWSHRQPKKVYTAEEYDTIDKHTNPNEEKIVKLDMQTDILPLQRNKRKTKINESNNFIDIEALDRASDKIHYKTGPKHKPKKAFYSMNSKTSKTTDMLETVIDANGDFIYTKLNNKDPIISQLLITVKSRKEQNKQDLILLEGKRLIRDALEAKCILQNLVFSRKSDIQYLKPHLPKSGAKIYKMPYREMQLWSDLTTSPGIMGIFKTPNVENYTSENSMGMTIVCDNIREPGNLGAVLRTAAGAGVGNIFLTKGCVDLWDTKVLRSACGAHFRLQIHKKMDWESIENKLESISDYSVLIADNKIVTRNIHDVDVQYDEPLTETSLENIITSIPFLPYYGASFKDLGSLVIVVGGETEGISEESYRFAADNNGIRLNIPLCNEIDSLNTGTALGIIMFEIKRQMSVVSSKE